MKRMWIRGGRVMDPATRFDEVADVLIEADRIAAIERNIAPKSVAAGEEVIDAKGLWVLPGLVDIHTHLRDPGYEHKETVASGTRAAARGGFTSVVCMANTYPVNDSATITQYILNKAKTEGKARVFPVGAVSMGLNGERLSEFGDLREAGVVALSDDGKPVVNSELFRHALEYARNFSLPIISHCEDPFLFHGGVMNEGRVSTELGLKGIPNCVEEIMVNRDIEIARLARGRLHLAHLSTGGSAELLRRAKEDGLAVTGEVTPHHLLLTEEAVRNYDTHAKMNPPLRAREDVEAVVKGLKEGVFDAIASDHAPHSVIEKQLEFDQAPFGITGLETTLSLMLGLVDKGVLNLMRLVHLLSWGPAQVMGLDQRGVGSLKKGAWGDVVVVDPESEWTYDAMTSCSKSRNTPFHGWKMKGAVCYTVLHGEKVYETKKSNSRSR